MKKKRKNPKRFNNRLWKWSHSKKLKFKIKINSMKIYLTEEDPVQIFRYLKET